MSYHIYTTEGIILKRVSFGEANLLLHILTSDLGLILASARSARLSLSKLRPALQEYAHVSVSCVKGKNGWKVTNVMEKGSLYFGYPEHSHKILANVVALLIKMIPGEAVHPEIFFTVKSGFEFLKSLEEKDVESLEILLVLRVLYQLGYVSSNLDIKDFLENVTDWDITLLQNVSEKKLEVIQIINKALRESHL